MNWQAIFLTLRLAVTVSALLVVIALPLAYWIAFSRWRWKFLVEALVAMPLVLPPTVLGFYFLLLLGRNGLVGGWLYRIFGLAVPFSFAGLVVASVLYSLPFAVQPLVGGFASVDRKLMAASALLGASPLRTFFRVVLPLSLAHLVTAVVLSFAHTLGEFGVVLMVGGNIPGVTRTISIAIYDDVQALNYSSASQNALFLLVLSFAILSLVYLLNRRASFFGTAA
jgi:molybdate transport system permease protein